MNACDNNTRVSRHRSAALSPLLFLAHDPALTTRPVLDSALQEECEKFGGVKSVHIPRPSTMSEQEKPGVGFVFVAFDAVDSSAKAAASLRARTFDGRKVPERLRHHKSSMLVCVRISLVLLMGVL